MGKGSNRRPNFVPLSELAARWDATFGKMLPPDTELRSTMVETPTGAHGVIFDISDRLPIPSDPDEQA